MKAIAFLNRTVVATLLASASIAAFAGGGPRGAGPYPYSGTTAMAVAAERADPAASPANAVPTAVRSVAHGKTREQVRAELLQAEEAGLIPVHRNDYPPSAETIARNRIRFQQIELAWHSDTATTMTEK